MSPEADRTPNATTTSDGEARRPSRGFTDAECDAMKERSKELKAATRRGRAADGEADVLAKIEEMPEADRAIAEQVHALVRATAPDLAPRTWYGMPAYARDRSIVCFFQSSQRFKTRYPTLGFSDAASLDEDGMWATAFAIDAWSADVAERVRALVARAAS